MEKHHIVILPAQRCRRSQRILKYLQDHGIFFQRIDLESSVGQEIAEKYEMRASPGILVDGVSYNPLDMLLKPDCRVDEGVVRTLFTPSERANVDENGR